MKFGFSVYPEFYKTDEIISHMRKASSYGATNCFLCLQLGEYGFSKRESADYEKIKAIIKEARLFGLKIVVDVTKGVFSDFQSTIYDLSHFKKMGIDTLRIDGGFTNKEVAILTRNRQKITIELNASFVSDYNHKLSEEFTELMELVELYGERKNLSASYNFYPRHLTGHSIDYIKDSLSLLKKFNLTTSAFVSSELPNRHFHNFSKGLCTIEEHRDLPVIQASQQLLLLGIDNIIIGDGLAYDYEFEMLSQLTQSKEYVELMLNPLPNIDEAILHRLLETTFTSRKDQPSMFIRCTELRNLDVKPLNQIERTRYSVTIDNKLSGRYCGEIQICLDNLQAVEYANVLGYIDDESVYLLQYISFGNKPFRFIVHSIK